MRSDRRTVLVGGGVLAVLALVASLERNEHSGCRFGRFDEPREEGQRRCLGLPRGL